MANQIQQIKTESIRNPLLLAEHFANSGYFQDTKDVSKAVVKIVAGQELGFGPMASITGFHVISGKPTLSANLMAAAIKRSGRYNYKVKQMTNEICEIEFFENNQPCGLSSFTLAEARTAGVKNLDKYPRNMLFARALSNGARWYCPDVLNGAPIYTAEELGADVDEDGEVVTTQATKYELAPELFDDLVRKTNELAELKKIEAKEVAVQVNEQVEATRYKEMTVQQYRDAVKYLTQQIEMFKNNQEVAELIPETKKLTEI